MKSKLEIIELDHEKLDSLIKRVEKLLPEEDVKYIKGMVETLKFISEKLKKKNYQIKRILKQIFGIKSEKSDKIFEDKNDNDEEDKHEKDNNIAPDVSGEEKEINTSTDHEEEHKEEHKESDSKKGHGRNGAESYTGAEIIPVEHTIYKNGDNCPDCLKGKLYKQIKPGIFIMIGGSPPIDAKIYELEKLRCNLCGKIFQADSPDLDKNIVDNPYVRKHYDESAKTIIIMLRYGYGFPLNRIAKLQQNLGIPLPVATQWDKIESAADLIYPAYEELKRQAAQGTIMHNDDTGGKILSVMKEIEEEKQTGKKGRTGIFTTGIISIVNNQKIGLFFTGRQHAGENTNDVCMEREENKSPPILMCDAKSGNTPKDTEVIECNCNVHARRYFVDVVEDFPSECQYVIVDVFAEIYKNESFTKKNKMSADERLEYHKKNSGPIMDKFYVWMNSQIVDKKVETNSTLGKAISYTLKNWEKLTRFLTIPGAPLDNNVCERAIKTAICHRKNSLFYKNEHGAYIGDMFMSLIYTCHLNEVNAFDYLTQLQKHSSDVFKNPSQWMPWNYKENLKLEQSVKGVNC